MTLIVGSFWTDPESGAVVTHVDWEDGHYMAGCEVARHTLWGSLSVMRRSARFLPQLSEHNLWVGPEELDHFEAEVRTLLQDAEVIAAELDRNVRDISHYLQNFLRAVALARKRQGGIWID